MPGLTYLWMHKDRLSGMEPWMEWTLGILLIVLIVTTVIMVINVIRWK